MTDRDESASGTLFSEGFSPFAPLAPLLGGHFRASDTPFGPVKLAAAVTASAGHHQFSGHLLADPRPLAGPRTPCWRPCIGKSPATRGAALLEWRWTMVPSSRQCRSYHSRGQSPGDNGQCHLLWRGGIAPPMDGELHGGTNYHHVRDVAHVLVGCVSIVGVLLTRGRMSPCCPQMKTATGTEF